MLELLFCATLTVLPDFLIRRFVQDKRIGREITLFSVWYELRYGLTACVILTISLITIVFYYHPSTKAATSLFRTVSILSERPGRVKEVYVSSNMIVKAGDRLFSLEDDEQQAAVTTARSRVTEIEAQMAVTEAELEAAQGVVDQAQSGVQQAMDELAVQQELLDRGSGAANRREVERLENLVASREGALASAQANYKAIKTKETTLLPAQMATAQAVLAEAETTQAQSVVYASIAGEIQQFALQPGDIVNPFTRTAGILVPQDVGRDTFFAGFGQVSAQVLKVGMVGEITCVAVPYVIIPVRITSVQDFLPSGQFRPSDRLLDVQEVIRPGSVLVTMAPIFEGSADRVPRGSHCIANAYTSNHELLHGDEELSTGHWLFLHMVDTVGLVHALILRIQALMLPVQTLVLSGH